MTKSNLVNIDQHRLESSKYLEKHGINPKKRDLRYMPTINTIIQTISLSGLIMPVGTLKWEYFSRVGDIDLIETLEITASSRPEVFDIVSNLIKQKLRNLALVHPIMYFTDFKGGEHPELRELYWRIDYTLKKKSHDNDDKSIDLSDTPCIDLSEVLRLTYEFHKSGIIGNYAYAQIKTSINLTEAHKLYRKMVLLRWHINDIVRHTPIKIYDDMATRDTITLSNALNMEPVVYKNIRISPPGIPQIKLDILTFVGDVLMPISYIINITWVNDTKIRNLSIFDNSYPVNMRYDVLKYMHDSPNYLKCFKRIWIMYIIYLFEKSINIKVRRKIEKAIIYVTQNIEQEIIVLDRYSAFFDAAVDLLILQAYDGIHSRYFIVQHIPYRELLENIYYIITKMCFIFNKPHTYDIVLSKEICTYSMTVLDTIHSHIIPDTEHNTISMMGTDSYLRVTISTHLTNLKKKLRIIIQKKMTTIFTTKRKKKILNDFEEIVLCLT